MNSLHELYRILKVEPLVTPSQISEFGQKFAQFSQKKLIPFVDMFKV